MLMDDSSFFIPDVLETAQLIKVPKWAATIWRQAAPGSVVGCEERTGGKNGRGYRVLESASSDASADLTSLPLLKSSCRPEKRLFIFRGDAVDGRRIDPVKGRKESMFAEVDEVVTVLPNVSQSRALTLKERNNPHPYKPTGMFVDARPLSSFGVIGREEHIFRFAPKHGTSASSSSQLRGDTPQNDPSATGEPTPQFALLPSDEGLTFLWPTAEAKDKIPKLLEDDAKRKVFGVFEASGNQPLSLKKLQARTGVPQRRLQKVLDEIAECNVDRTQRKGWTLKAEFDASRQAA